MVSSTESLFDFWKLSLKLPFHGTFPPVFFYRKSLQALSLSLSPARKARKNDTSVRSSHHTQHLHHRKPQSQQHTSLLFLLSIVASAVVQPLPTSAASIRPRALQPDANILVSPSQLCTMIHQSNNTCIKSTAITSSKPRQKKLREHYKMSIERQRPSSLQI
jgi:hypothetical protein